MLKKISFWTTLLGVIICLFHYLGYDDMNIILYLTSPPFWILEKFIIQIHLLSLSYGIYILYLITILFWFLAGLFIDKITKAKKSKYVK